MAQYYSSSCQNHAYVVQLIDICDPSNNDTCGGVKSVYLSFNLTFAINPIISK